MKTYKEFKKKSNPFFVGFIGRHKSMNEQWEHPFTGKDYYDDTQPIGKHIDTIPNNLREKHYFFSKHYDPVNFHREISEYTDESSDLNNFLVDRHKGNMIADRQEEIEYLNKEHSLRELFEEPNSRAPHDLHVYSGVGFSPARYSKGDNSTIKVYLPAFTSTSINPEIAAGHANYDPSHEHYWTHGHLGEDFAKNLNKTRHMIKIHVPEGARSSYIANYSAHPPEAEMLLNNRATLHIHHKPDYDEENNVAVWHAKLVHDGVEPTRHMDEE